MKQPYNPQCPQVCMDAMSPQLIGEVRAPLPAEPGKPLRYDTEYKRNGTANIFIAFEPLNGQRYTKVTEQRTKVDWAYFMRELVDQHYPPKHGSWLNMAEIELSHLSRQCLADRIEDRATLRHEVQAWNKKRNDRQAKAH